MVDFSEFVPKETPETTCEETAVYTLLMMLAQLIPDIENDATMDILCKACGKKKQFRLKGNRNKFKFYQKPL